MLFKLKWRVSYKTVRFNTLDGDLSKNQFCRYKRGFLVRQHPKNNHHIVFIENLNTSEMEEAQIINGDEMYYDEFELPNGRILRLLSKKKKYWDTAKIPNYPQPSKEITDEEISEIVKDDNLWQ